jgi:hypothetical protein
MILEKKKKTEFEILEIKYKSSDTYTDVITCTKYNGVFTLGQMYHLSDI